MENFETAYKQKAPILIRYFKTKPVLRESLARLEVEKNNDNLQAILQGVILCIQKCLDETEQSLMFPVDEMASNEEIESLNSESWPRLAMLGENSLAAREFASIVDDQVIGRYRSYLEAISLLFCVYYIFNIEYPEKGAATLEFIQRCFVGINPSKGVKANKKRRASGVNAKVFALINQVTDFQWIG